MAPKLGTLSHVTPREIWPNEARNFTPWLADHIGQLGETLGMDLDVEGQEVSVGTFSLDILARDLGTDRRVVIENQLEKTDHDHLGKLLTYAAGFDASVVIWIAAEAREEHRQSIDWLNQHSDSDTEFFLIVLEVLRIGDSSPAANFRAVAYPNEWRRERNTQKQPPTERAERYRIYFQELIDELRDAHGFTGAKQGQPQSWYSFSSGVSGIKYGTSFANNDRVRAHVYLQLKDRDINKLTFDIISEHSDALEASFGEALEWERLESKHAARIAIYRPGSIDSDDAALSEIRAWAVSRLLRLKEVFGPRLTEWVAAAEQGVVAAAGVREEG
jgi:hypothetical protein